MRTYELEAAPTWHRVEEQSPPNEFTDAFTDAEMLDLEEQAAAATASANARESEDTRRSTAWGNLAAICCSPIREQIVGNMRQMWSASVIFGRPAWSDAFSVAKTAPLHGRTPGACQLKYIPRGSRKSEVQNSSRFEVVVGQK